ncbi:hypothetical protein CHS0354_026158, partial [Potamilus streckersoni]
MAKQGGFITPLLDYSLLDYTRKRNFPTVKKYNGSSQLASLPLWTAMVSQTQATQLRAPQTPLSNFDIETELTPS